LAIVVGFVVVWAAILFGSAWVHTRRQAVETHSLHRELPAPGTSAPSDPARPSHPISTAAGTVVLDFVVGEFHIRRGRSGEGIRVEAEFDTNSYELTQEHETAEDGTWIHRITFRETNIFRDNGLRALLGGAYPNVRVFLPPDVPLALHGHFAKGWTDLELGGLWLTEIDVTAEKGGIDFDFDRPTIAPLEKLHIRAKQGGLSVRQIGNASPRTVDIDHRMGGMNIDLHGNWLRDADVRIKNMMGGGKVSVPDNVRVEWTGDVTVPGESLRPQEIPQPNMRLSIASFWGSANIDR
jgi:hypothetical protein